MFATVLTHGRGRRTALASGLLLAALVATGPAGSAAQAGTVPEPAPGDVVGVASLGGGAVTPRVDLFYRRRSDRSLLARRLVPDEPLGGTLTSGVAAAATNAGEFVDETAYTRGTDGAIWYRTYSGSRDAWQAWASLGGRARGAPGVTTFSHLAMTVVYVTGVDGALWRRTPGTWSSAGGRLVTDPAGMTPAPGSVAPLEEVFGVGADHAVWEWTHDGGWRRIGGLSNHAPTATMLPDGGARLFVVGVDGALWTATRGSGAFVTFRRVGAAFTSAPTAVVDTTTDPATVSVYGLGTDHRIWRVSDVIGGPEEWTATPVP